MLKKDLYTQGHLVVSAIRVLEHRTGKPPTVEDICQMLLLSLEQGHLLCKRLHEAGVIDREEGAFGVRLMIEDHLKIESLPREAAGKSLQEEVERFKKTQQSAQEKIEAFQAKKAQEKKALFAKIEEQLKQGKGK